MPRNEHDYPTWGVDPTWGGPMANPGGGAVGATGGGGFDMGAWNIDPAFQAALDAIKRGNNRFGNVMEILHGQGLLGQPGDINADWLSQMLGQNLPGKTGQFLGRVQNYMQSGQLPRDGGGGQGGSPIPENLQAGGGGGGGGGRMRAGKHVDRNPFGGALGEYIKGIIDRLNGQQGYDQDLLDAWFGQARESNALQERDRLMRRGEDYAARGLFGSGLQNRDMERIEQQQGQNLQQAYNAINLENARAAQTQVAQLLQALGMATGRELGLGNLDLGYGNLDLGWGQLDLSRELGIGNLRLGEAGLAMDSAYREWLMMMMAAQNWMQPGGGGSNVIY